MLHFPVTPHQVRPVSSTASQVRTGTRTGLQKGGASVDVAGLRGAGLSALGSSTSASFEICSLRAAPDAGMERQCHSLSDGGSPVEATVDRHVIGAGYLPLANKQCSEAIRVRARLVLECRSREESRESSPNPGRRNTHTERSVVLASRFRESRLQRYRPSGGQRIRSHGVYCQARWCGGVERFRRRVPAESKTLG